MRVPAAKFSDVPKTTSGLRLEVAVEDALLGRRAAAGAELEVDELERRRLLLERARVGDASGSAACSSSLNSAPLAKLVTPKRWTKMVFGPIARIMSRSDWSKPRISDVMPTIDVMPMTTPSTVSAERILLVRTVSNAIDDDFA